MSVTQLASRLEVNLSDPSILDVALTHRSMPGANNERLEFVGDAVLGAVIADMIYHAFPNVDEGVLSRIRASLVNKRALAKVANELKLSAHLHLGEGELKSGGHRRASILADAVEAILAAVYLDQGFGEAKALIERLFASHMAALGDPELLKDYKTRLQEHVQAKGWTLPQYELIDMTGEAHNRHFKVSCLLVETNQKHEGEGSSRRIAEQVAAQGLLALLTSST